MLSVSLALPVLSLSSFTLAGAGKHRFKWSNIFLYPKIFPPHSPSFYNKCKLYTEQHAPNTPASFEGSNTIQQCSHALLPLVFFFFKIHSPAITCIEISWGESRDRFYRCHACLLQEKMQLSLYVLQCRIQVRSGYFINQVRPAWPGENVTRLTWPGNKHL